eukprot:m.14082 g.14082  ORF g.14082 m.14082 type:complete len:99 (+) comp4981_c0_seq1:175-471(+)
MADEDIRKNFNYAITVKTDMTEEMAVDTQETAVTAIEKHSGNYEAASKLLHEEMCKKYGGGWHVVIGEGFGNQVTHDHGSLLFMFFGGLTAVLVWKCN